jgi:hypothetical protein
LRFPVRSRLAGGSIGTSNKRVRFLKENRKDKL